MTLDELRAANPELAFAVYALEPGGPVTFEVHTPDGSFYTFLGESEAAAIAKAFPDAGAAQAAHPAPAVETAKQDVFE